MRNYLSSVLTHREFAFLQVSKEVSTGKVLHHDVYMVLVFENIKQSNNIGVLAHLENFDLSSLQLYIGHRHLLLRHNLDSHVLAGLLVGCCLH